MNNIITEPLNPIIPKDIKFNSSTNLTSGGSIEPHKPDAVVPFVLDKALPLKPESFPE